MNQHDFRVLVHSGVVDQVILHRRSRAGDFELWAFGDGWPGHLGNRLRVTRPDHRPDLPSEKTWVNLGTAVHWIRKSGWMGTIEVEERVNAEPIRFCVIEGGDS